MRLAVRLSVTARITLLALGLALVSSVVLIGVIWRQAHVDALSLVERETTERAQALAAVWGRGGSGAVVDAINHARVPGDRSLMLAVLDGSGRRLVGFAPSQVGVPLRDTPFAVADVDGSASTREAGYTLHRAGDGWLLVGRSLDVFKAEQGAVERALGLALLVSLALGLGAGVVVARYVAHRLDAIAGVIDAAAAGNLSLRVAAPTGGDAFDRLAERLNTMLARTERLMGELRVVTDSLAHDLRSPLARLRTRAEQAVTVADPAAREAALGGLLAETDLVMRMLTTVIEISRSEATTRDRFTRVVPAELIEGVAELYGPVVEEAGLAFHVEVADRVPAMPLHRELLSQAVANLLDNALRHGVGGGEVTLRLVRLAQGVAVSVEDRGPGIAAADRAQALKRFGRLDTARSTPGAGLGMALVEAVARLHGGRFELADNAPGLVARLVLPG
jgi:signal transduction histidine kinase